ncbi:hypothetical protein, partial [Propionivibrio sp.]|uniref:hypothetical protein n=1 Tax=Propionivibrio sp. TaxID=2212460 RepID=UPI003BF28C6C
PPTVATAKFKQVCRRDTIGKGFWCCTTSADSMFSGLPTCQKRPKGNHKDGSLLIVTTLCLNLQKTTKQRRIFRRWLPAKAHHSQGAKQSTEDMNMNKTTNAAHHCSITH